MENNAMLESNPLYMDALCELNIYYIRHLSSTVVRQHTYMYTDED